MNSETNTVKVPRFLRKCRKLLLLLSRQKFPITTSRHLSPHSRSSHTADLSSMATVLSFAASSFERVHSPTPLCRNRIEVLK